MKLQSGKFIVTRANGADPVTLNQDGLVIGRMPSCDIYLNHPTISRIHAGINCISGQYFLINLSVSNSLTLNGRSLKVEQVDTLADGDVIQLGPFALGVSRQKEVLSLLVRHQFASDVTNSTRRLPALAEIIPQQATAEVSDVLKVFWEKRSREKEDTGTPLRPVSKPLPGKAQINWRPTKDLKPAWRGGLFTWSLLIIALLIIPAFYFYPQVFAPAALSSPHVRSSFNGTEAGFIANRPNANACSTCHSWNESIDNSCVKCHKADAFHATNTAAHQAAGINCSSCHAEHKGENFTPRIAAFDSCAACHNDDNKNLYNGKAVSTPHGISHGYPMEDGQWKWGGLKPETAAMSEDVIKYQETGDSEQIRRNKEFHGVHMYRVTPAPEMKTDANGAMSCSSCHQSFDPIDRQTPRQTCAACHNGYVDRLTKQTIVSNDRPNCVSCHVQHYYDKNRWREFLTNSTRDRRAAEIDLQIKKLGEENPVER